MFEYTNYTKPTRIGHQADQERLGYSNYTKPTRIGHQADQEMLGYSNYTKPTLLFVRNMPLAVAARDPSTEIPLLGQALGNARAQEASSPSWYP